MESRIGFLGVSSAFGAALAAVVITLMFALYLPATAIICSFLPSAATPEVRAGERYFEKPDTFIVTVQREGRVFVGPARVSLPSLTGELRRARQTWPGRPLELRVDGRVKLGELAPVLDSARDAGYHAYYVFGPEQSILHLEPRA